MGVMVAGCSYWSSVDLKDDATVPVTRVSNPDSLESKRSKVFTIHGLWSSHRGAALT